MHLEGKVAIVTGASRGIGRAVAINLAQSGADVVVNYSGSEGAAQETVEAVQALGRKAIKIKANVANADEVASMVEEAHKEFGHIDILVNNAGITRDGLLIGPMWSLNKWEVLNAIEAEMRRRGSTQGCKLEEEDDHVTTT